MQNPTCGECGKSLAELRMQARQDVLAELNAAAQAKAEAEEKAEAEDDLRFLLETSINPEMTLWEIQNGLW